MHWTIFPKKMTKLSTHRKPILWLHLKNVSAENLKKTFEDLHDGVLIYYLLGNKSYAANKNKNTLNVTTKKGVKSCGNLKEKNICILDSTGEGLLIKMDNWKFNKEELSNKELKMKKIKMNMMMKNILKKKKIKIIIKKLIYSTNILL